MVESCPFVQVVAALPFITKPLLQDTVYCAPLEIVAVLGLTVPAVTVGLLQGLAERIRKRFTDWIHK